MSETHKSSRAFILPNKVQTWKMSEGTVEIVPLAQREEKAWPLSASC